ncbi:MAG: Bifunctional PGK/TIM [Chlamydiae bacterium]|nr:Bifunctional PGK/TIM [Chlamydiota bacterium]
MDVLTIQDLDLKNKKVLMRVDFNVPLDSKGNITDDTRIQAAIPSIQYVLDHGGSVILMSHLGRPKKLTPELSLKPCAERLSQLLSRPVSLVDLGDCNPQPGEVFLLENLRFIEAEKKPEKDPQFAKQLAQLADVYVNDAFGTAHRKHSSTYEVAKYFPGKAAAGFLMQKEIEYLARDPEHPFYAIIGGAKISTKIGVLMSLLDKVDALFICGAMAHTFLKAQGHEVGDSLYEEDVLQLAKEIIKKCSDKDVFLGLPLDEVVVEDVVEGAPSRLIEFRNEGIPKGFKGVDIGPKTLELYQKKLADAKTVLWNGPAGVFEITDFMKGTEGIARVLADLPATTIVGGGDSVAALKILGLSDKMSHISTGGGASLELIEKGTLPGIEALSAKKSQ